MATAADAHQQRSASNPFIPPNMSELRVVLLGNSWSQRRDVGNVILGEAVFNTEEPDCCVRVSGWRRGKETVLINTPDLLHPNISEDKLTEFIKNCVRLSAPGPHVFLLVLQPEDFTEEQRLKLQTVLEDFGDQSFEHSLVLISTPAKELLAHTENYQQHPPLNHLVRMCRYRHLKQRDLELQELWTRFGQIVRENNGEHVSCDLSETDGSHPNLTTKPANMDPARAAARGLRIVLFGKSEEEKTIFGNFITKKTSFQFRNISPAKHCEGADAAWKEEPLTAVKTPDMFSLSVERVREEMKSCVSLCPPGPNVLLLLVKPSDFTEENRKTLKFILSLFGEDCFKHSMIISTHRHQWKETSISVNKLLQDCDGRHYNMSENDLQLLMDKIEDMVQKTKGTFLTFTEENAAMKLEKQKDWERKEKEWQKNQQQEIERIRQEEEEKHKKLQEEFEEREKSEKKQKEDRLRREQEEKERKALEENYRSKMEDMQKKYEEEARKEAEEFNEVRAQCQKDLEAPMEKHLKELKALKEQHEKEMDKKRKQNEDRLRREQEEKERKALEENYRSKMEDMQKKYEEEARKEAEQFNEVREKYRKDVEALMEKHHEELKVLKEQYEKVMQQKPETHRKEYKRLQELISYKEKQLKEQLEQKEKVFKDEIAKKDMKRQKEMDKKRKQKEEDQIRREQEELEEIRSKMGDMKKNYDEVRKEAEEFNEVRAKCQKDLEALMEKHHEELKALKEQHEKEMDKKRKQNKDQIRREQEEKERKALEENYRSKMEDMKKKYEEEARKKVEEFNEFRAKYIKGLESLNKRL